MKRSLTRLLFFVVLTLGLLNISSVSMAQPSGVTLPPCSASIHNYYQTIGPDGWQYPTWHPVIDLANGCYHNHEHGSNPAFANPGQGWTNTNWPAFGYSASLHGMPEPHAGFKVYVFDLQGVRFTLLHHFGTGNAVGAACNQHHTLDVQARSLISGTLLFDMHSMADFGKSVFNRNSSPFTPTACPENPTIPGTGVRQLPGAWDDVGYEPWRVASGVNEFGFEAKALTFNTFNPQMSCADMNCSANIARSDIGGPARGTYRNLTLYAGFGFPGWTLTQMTECWPFGADYFYVCGNELRPKVDATLYRINPFVTGGN